MFFFWNSWFHGPTPVHPTIRGFPETIGKKRKPKGPVRRPRVDHEEKSCHGMYWSTSSSGAAGLSRTRILTSFSWLFPLYHSLGHMTGGIYRVVSPFPNFRYVLDWPLTGAFPILTTHKCVPAVGLGLRTQEPTGTQDIGHMVFLSPYFSPFLQGVKCLSPYSWTVLSRVTVHIGPTAPQLSRGFRRS